MADNRRPSSVPSEDFYKTRMANSSNISRKSSMQAGTETSQIVCADRSLFIFSKENFIRKICRTIVESKVSFDANETSLYKMFSQVWRCLWVCCRLLQQLSVRAEDPC